MQNWFRHCAAALATLVLLIGLAHPAAAIDRMYEVGDKTSSVPMVFDIFFMRPLGLALSVTGAMIYAFPVVPMMAIVRPSDIGKPFQPLVVAPVKFTFADPIGQHP